MRRACALAMAVWCSGAPGAAHAQSKGWLGWGPMGELGMSADLRSGAATDRPRVGEHDVRGWLALSLAGQVPAERWLAYAWTVRPAIVRSGGDAEGARAEARDLAHQLSIQSQPRSTLRMQFSADRDRLVAERGLDGSREARFFREEGRAEWRTPLARFGALARGERSDERWVTTALAPELERRIRRRSLETWIESSKLRVAQRRTFEQPPGSGPESRTVHTTADHRFAWGRGSRLTSRLEWADQSQVGATLIDRSIEEALHVRHANWLASDYRLRTTHARFAAGEGRTASHDATLAARTDGMGASLSGAWRTDRSPGREGRVAAIGPRVHGQRAWKHATRVALETGAMFESERRTGAADARVAVTGEVHTVDATRTFVLGVDGPDSLTVRVRDGSGGEGYLEGLDYVLIRQGTRLVVVVPPGSRFSPGDVMLLTYEANPPGVPGRTSTRVDAGLTAEWRGLRLRVDEREQRARDTPTERGAARLAAREFGWLAGGERIVGAVRLDASVGERHRRVERREARTRDARLSASWQPATGWLVTGDASWALARDAVSELDVRAMRARIDWSRSAVWRWSLTADQARFDRPGVERTRQSLVSAETSARWGRLDASLRLDAGRRSGGPGHRFRRATLALVRRFR